VRAPGYESLSLVVTVMNDTELTIQMRAASTVTVVAPAGESNASAQVYSADDLPRTDGRPGAPFSVPGLPSETASGGVKAPQYFAPGVAGDHGEPIAQYIRVGDFLFQNNLPANAHGNGYADPNLLIAASIGNVESGAGAFDVRHGNNAVNAAVAYELRPRVEPVVQFSGDGHNYDFVTAWSPQNAVGEWLGAEVSGGNGFLALPERRRQFKLDAYRSFGLGRHQLTVFAAGYYGYSRIPGLVPLNGDVVGDTIDPRQAERTSTGLLVASDTWQASSSTQLQFSAFFRGYALNLKSNFGEGLIRQSESRTVRGGNALYDKKLGRGVLIIAGADLRQDLPRNTELARADAAGVFQPVMLNDFTITNIAPYVSLRGKLTRYFSFGLGFRRDEILFHDVDRLTPSNSYHARSEQTSPRATLSFHVPGNSWEPLVAFSYGEGFHSNDPRIGIGTNRGTPIATSRVMQLSASKWVAGTEFRLSLNRTANSQEVAKIDPDTGLQENVGPSLVRAVMFSARRHFSFGMLQGTFARAQAKDKLSGGDVPEAPRLICDVSGTILRLPGKLRASGEFEYVGRKQLGDGFNAVAVREIRGALTRSFRNNLFEAGLYFLLADGYTGQTLERLQWAGGSTPSEQIVGVRNPSHAGLRFVYHFRARQD
jgi:hypothetical protein